MKKINIQVIISSIRAKTDGSLGLSMSTPELSNEEKVEVMRLQNKVLEAVFIPLDSPDVPDYRINTDLEQKTPSQRLRGVIYRMWELNSEGKTFEEYYKEVMEKFINKLKEKLN